ncbi:MAG: hypothetical protein FJ098_06795, partial [Deltaproteobacteria bacterium]|nr:hypothetical protein [Deltaproteobacteria bacterium]
MKKSAISTLALMLVLAAGCSTDPGGGGGLDIPGVDTVPPDTTIDQGGDGPVNPDACPGGTCPDTDEDAPCENKCEPGQVLCTTETRFKACEEGPDGCLDFVGATTFCDGANHEVCICWTGEDEANWCLPEGEPCQCIPACDGKDCGPDGCGDTCGECREEQVCNLDTGVCEGEDPDQTCAECVTSCEPGGDGINCCEEGQQTCNGAKVISCEDKYPEDEGCDCWKWLDPAG